MEEIACVEPYTVPVYPFFKKTSLNTWEGSLFFDSWSGSLSLNPTITLEGSLIKIVPKKLVITMFIPESYDIVPSDKLKLEQHSGYYMVTSELEPGESLDIKVAEKSFYEPLIIGITFLCPLVIGVLLGLLVDPILQKRKSK